MAGHKREFRDVIKIIDGLDVCVAKSAMGDGHPDIMFAQLGLYVRKGSRDCPIPGAAYPVIVEGSIPFSPFPDSSRVNRQQDNIQWNHGTILYLQYRTVDRIFKMSKVNGLSCSMGCWESVPMVVPMVGASHRGPFELLLCGEISIVTPSNLDLRMEK